MSKKDKLFTLMEGLNPCIRMELQRQRVDLFAKVIECFEFVVDKHLEVQKDKQKKLEDTRGLNLYIVVLIEVGVVQIKAMEIKQQANPWISPQS